MHIVGLMAARNEEWILGLSARAALMWLDGLVILDHASTDRTPEIIDELVDEAGGRICVRTWRDTKWEEMAQRQAMLLAARNDGATHIVYIDADEILTGDLLPRIHYLIATTPARSNLELPWIQLRGSINRYHASGVWGEQNASFAFVDSPELHWSSASRNGYDFHQRPPLGRAYLPHRPLGPAGEQHFRQSGLMHLQMVNGRRLRAKQALYQATEVLRWPGRESVDAIRAKYSLAVYGKISPPPLDFDLAECPESWWKPYAHLMQYFNPSMVPWQEAELLRMIDEHGPQKFAGLDFFGIGEEELVRR